MLRAAERAGSGGHAGCAGGADAGDGAIRRESPLPDQPRRRIGGVPRRRPTRPPSGQFAMAVRSAYPNRLAYVPALAALAAVSAGAGIARAAQQGYTKTAWTGALLGAAAAVGAALVGTARWRAAFSRGYFALAALGSTALALVHTRAYPRAEGLLFAAGILAASAFLMGWDELARARRLHTRLSESGLLDRADTRRALERYLDELAAPLARVRG